MDENVSLYPSAEHDKHVLYTLVEAYGRELAVMREIVTRLDKTIFGNGSPGALARMEERHESLRKSLEAKIDRMTYAALFAAVAFVGQLLILLLKK